MIYINRKDSDGLETVDQFDEGHFYAKSMLDEYRLADTSAYYYMSQRACKAWHDRQGAV